ncbi:MAG: ATP-binding protein [Candidatus Omnitrophica bacterium]|nr:ATP-binding protein [Candidatus Omnitrophota bacterium]
MKFYDRNQEINELKNLMAEAKKSGRMTVLTGRRRVGKTLLSMEVIQGQKHVYFFVTKKSEALLCAEYLQEIRKVFGDSGIEGEIRSFSGIFQLLLRLAQNESFTLVVDEFQEFYNINPSVYSEIQKLWDLNKNKSRLNVIFIGSVYSLMHKIFQNSKEPLFNRADRIFLLKPFSVETINLILRDYGIDNVQVLFDYYVFTGGMPKYIDLLVENSAFSLEAILDFMIKSNSPFIHEGKNLLIEEFGKEYGTYFSVLELISSGKTARSEMESILESDVGGYLDRLEKDYAIIDKYKPIDAKPNSRLQKYRIIDNFLNFWFRFIYRNRSAVETGNFEYIRNVIKNDYSTYCGRVLERFYCQLFAESRRYNRIGSYWEKGNHNEIDLVAVNDLKKEISVAEVKLNKEKIDLDGLKEKARRLIACYPEYRFRWMSLSLQDAGEFFG